MKKLVLFCFLVLAVTVIKAQRVYFIYLQNESSEAFFLRMDEKLYSSTASGYLILPKLKDSTYNVKIGFPGKELELNFSLVINRKDKGYLIKNFGDKGWGLFDLQTLGVQMSASPVKTAVQFNNEGKVDAFTDLLSRAANDPSIKSTPMFARLEEKKAEPVVVKEEKKPEPVVVKEDKKPEVTSAKAPATEEKKTEVVINTPPPTEKSQRPDEVTVKTPDEVVYKRSKVIKVSGTSTSNGLELNFVDVYPDGKKDTVNIVIPEEKQVVLKEEPKETPKKEDPKFIEVTNETKETINPTDKVPEKTTAPRAVCKVVAKNDDFLKLRRKMAAQTNDDGMVGEAKKYYKTKCFTTEYVKNLCSMFLSNAGKLYFFEASYPYVADRENFGKLVSELKDEYYIRKFKEKF